MLTKECDIVLQPEEHIIQKVEGTNHSLLFTNQNRLFVKGQNAFGQLGLGHFKEQKRFVLCYIPLGPDEKIKHIVLGLYHSLILTDKNRVLGSGFNYLDQLHFGDRTIKLRFVECPITLEENELITEMEAGFSYSQLKTNQNQVITFGDNTSRYSPALFSPKPHSTEEIVVETDIWFHL